MKKSVLFLLVSLILAGLNVKAQTALEFDGDNDYVQTTYPGIFENNPRTLMAWIYLDELPAADMCILDYGYDEEGSRNALMVNEAGYLQFDMGGDMLVGTFGGTLPVNEWVHVAFVYDGNEGILYVNGGMRDNGNLDMLTFEDEEPLRIGQSITGDMPFAGKIDEVSIWEMAMDEFDISNNACIDSDAIPSDVVAYYDFNDGSGFTLTELVDGWDGDLENMTEEDWVISTICATPFDITFVVTKDDGVTPIENAEVDLDGEVQYTDANGETVFALLAGTYNYTVSKGGYFDQTSSVEVVDDDVTVEVSMSLNGINYNVTFTVTDGVDPVEDAMVDLDGVQLYTDASGQAVFTELLPETYAYVVKKDGFFPNVDQVDVIDGDVAIDVSLLVQQATALQYDGSGYVQTSCPGVSGNNPRTLMAWVYRQAGLTANKVIMDYGRNSAYGRNTFMVNGSGYLVYLSGGAGSGLTADVAPVPEEEWVHVAFVYDGSDASIYQNGVLVGTKTFDNGINTPTGYTDLRIGRRVGSTLIWKGMIDEASVWEVALTPEEVQEYACIGDPDLHEGLMAYYTFNEGTGTTLYDIVGGNNGTLSNMDEENWVASDVCVPEKFYPEGWTTISSNVLPADRVLLEDLFAPVIDDMVILLGEDGIFWPGYNINTIGHWDTYKGYKVKFANAVDFEFEGSELTDKTVTLEPGTHYFPVLSTGPASVEDVIEPHGDAVEYVFDLVNQEIFWPNGGIVPGVEGALDLLTPGYAYLIFVNETVTLDFDVIAQTKSGETQAVNSQFAIPANWNNVSRTGSQHILSIQAANLDEGDVVGVFAADGTCTGMVRYNGLDEMMSLIVYGDDMTTTEKDGMVDGETMTFNIYSKGAYVEVCPVYNQQVANHNGLYAENGLSIITDFKMGATGVDAVETLAFSITPNPSNGKINITMAGIDGCEISVMNMNGQQIYATQVNGSTMLDLSSQPAGVYFVRISNATSTSIEKIVIE